MSKYRLAAVNYLNTIPLLEGIKHHPINSEVQIIPRIPVECAELFAVGDADISLVPVGALHRFEQYNIFSDYCIGSDGPVKTVCVFSHQPFESLKTVILDRHSMTSNMLVKIIASLQKLDIQFLFPEENGHSHENCGHLMIGDKTIGQIGQWQYQYDLGEAWKKITGLPFAFAVWVASPGIPDSVIVALNEAFASGLTHIQEVIRKYQSLYPAFDLKTYFQTNIDYSFDRPKQQALTYFLELSKNIHSVKIH